MQEVNLGQYALPYVIMIVLALAFKPFDRMDGTSSIPDWGKGYIAVLIGVILGIVGMIYACGISCPFRTWVDYILYGLDKGFAAVGVFKIAQMTPYVPVSAPKK